MLVRLVLNSRPQVICTPWPPKYLNYRHEPPHPASFFFFFLFLPPYWMDGWMDGWMSE